MEKNIFKKADVAMIGLSTMGANLTLNMSDKGYSVAVYSVDKEEADTFMTDYAKGRNIWQTDSLKELIMMLKPPRKFFLMIKAGKPVDEIIERLLSDIEKGDLIIDGGNSHFEDTTRRVKYLEKKGILFIGTGISGGENGARNGAS